MIESEADRRALIRDAGERVIIDGKAVDGIFTSRFERLAVNDSFVAAQRTELKLMNEDVPRNYRGVVCSVRGKQYRIENVEHDSDGFSVLMLTLAE